MQKMQIIAIMIGVVARVKKQSLREFLAQFQFVVLF
jgi:hypothetical protein